MPQALEAESSGLEEQERSEHLRLSDRDYRALVGTATTELRGGRAYREDHRAATVRGALGRLQRLRRAACERHSPRQESAAP